MIALMVPTHQLVYQVLVVVSNAPESLYSSALGEERPTLSCYEGSSAGVQMPEEKGIESGGKEEECLCEVAWEKIVYAWGCFESVARGRSGKGLDCLVYGMSRSEDE